jgi:hypothetical protein
VSIRHRVDDDDVGVVPAAAVVVVVAPVAGAGRHAARRNLTHFLK